MLAARTIRPDKQMMLQNDMSGLNDGLANGSTGRRGSVPMVGSYETVMG
jgi:hypothetical protein